jgi:hypothetical protein
MRISRVATRAWGITLTEELMMKTHAQSSSRDEGSAVADAFRAALLLIWCVVRVPIVVVLAFLEPFVRLMLSGIAVLSVLAGLVYKGSNVPPPIPFWVTLCVSVGCLLLVPIYHGLLRLLTR